MSSKHDGSLRRDDKLIRLPGKTAIAPAELPRFLPAWRRSKLTLPPGPMIYHFRMAGDGAGEEARNCQPYATLAVWDAEVESSLVYVGVSVVGSDRPFSYKISREIAIGRCRRCALLHRMGANGQAFVRTLRKIDVLKAITELMEQPPASQRGLQKAKMRLLRLSSDAFSPAVQDQQLLLSEGEEAPGN